MKSDYFRSIQRQPGKRSPDFQEQQVLPTVSLKKDVCYQNVNGNTVALMAEARPRLNEFATGLQDGRIAGSGLMPHCRWSFHSWRTSEHFGMESSFLWTLSL
jgi:hypothetical protein